MCKITTNKFMPKWYFCAIFGERLKANVFCVAFFKTMQILITEILTNNRSLIPIFLYSFFIDYLILLLAKSFKPVCCFKNKPHIFNLNEVQTYKS